MTGAAAHPEAPVGVFDSGLGGLTVLRAICSRLPAESVIYLGDTARVPYGPKSADTVRRYSLEVAEFLVGRGVKTIVMACNTATSLALDAVSAAVDVPVLGVIEPGAVAAARMSEEGRIGVIGTLGTIASGAYEEAILRHRPQAEVFTQACPLLVGLVEEGWTDGQVARLTVETYLRPLIEKGVDTLMLACTHYPLLAPLLAEVAGRGIRLVDSAEATAEALAELLGRRDLAASGGPGSRKYFVTDEAARFSGLAHRLLGEDIGALERVSVDSTC